MYSELLNLTYNQATRRIIELDMIIQTVEAATEKEQLSRAIQLADFDPIETELQELKTEIVLYAEQCALDIEKEFKGIFDILN